MCFPLHLEKLRESNVLLEKFDKFALNLQIGLTTRGNFATVYIRVRDPLAKPFIEEDEKEHYNGKLQING